MKSKTFIINSKKYNSFRIEFTKFLKAKSNPLFFSITIQKYQNKTWIPIFSINKSIYIDKPSIRTNLFNFQFPDKNFSASLDFNIKHPDFLPNDVTLSNRYNHVQSTYRIFQTSYPSPSQSQLIKDNLKIIKIHNIPQKHLKCKEEFSYPLLLNLILLCINFGKN